MSKHDEFEIALILMNILQERGEDIEDEFSGAGISDYDAVSYEEAGVLTRDAGLVLQLNDGTEFQITVVRCR